MNTRRILEPIFLGSIANILINYLFDPIHPAFIVDEFAIAILLCIPITELNRYIDKALEKRYSWTVDPVKRFFYHLLLLALVILISLNILGNGYMLFSGKSLFRFHEIFQVNIITFLLVLILTISNWMLYFLQLWRKSELELGDSKQILHDLEYKIGQSQDTLELQKGHKKYFINIEQIRLAIFNHGIVWIYTAGGERYIYGSTIYKLNKILPDHLFYSITRKAIIHYKTVQSISSGAYGKIELIIIPIDNVPQHFTVSRLKASSFRSWLKGTSTSNI